MNKKGSTFHKSAQEFLTLWNINSRAVDAAATPRVDHVTTELYGGAEGSHATPSGVAVTQFAYPDAIKSVPLDPPVALWGNFTDAADYRRTFADGRIGSNPALATPGAGRRLYEATVAALTAGYLG